MTHDPSPPGLTIGVSTGTGTGRTRLGAFDSALCAAGVGDFNLVRLSSVIPPRSTVTTVSGGDQLPGDHGDLLHCVYAAAYCSTPHAEAWAGLGWSLATDGSGAGLFVEHAGMSEHEIVTDIGDSLRTVSENRGGRFEPADIVTASIRCTDTPVCAVAIATYRVSGWHPEAGFQAGAR